MGRADFESREFEAFLTRSKDFTMIISASINFTPWSFAFGQDWTKRVEEQKAMKLEDELSLEFNKHLAFLSYDDFGLSNPP
jgi:HKD family nuclease